MSVIDTVPQLKRGRVWCTVCGRSQQVSAGECFRYGWPECCGQTMTIDSPEERYRLKSPYRDAKPIRKARSKP